MSVKTFVVAYDDGLDHLIEVRDTHPGGAMYTHVWCDAGPWWWSNPPFVETPATCIRCHARKKPKLRDFVD